MLTKLIILLFRRQAAEASKMILINHVGKPQIHDIIKNYWTRYLLLRPNLQQQPTLGGNIMIHLSAMSTAFYHELRGRNISEEKTTQIFYDTAWLVYYKMGKLSWLIAGVIRQKKQRRLLLATQLFRLFPFNSPSYLWEDIKAEKDNVCFNCIKCPVADYFKSQNLAEFCVLTWCKLDFPLANMWGAKLERAGSIAGGADRCDFKWVLN